MLLRKRISIIFTLGFLSISFFSSAQNISVGFPGLEDYYRRAQLLGIIDSTFSFTARPFNPIETLGITDPFDPEGTLVNTRLYSWDGTAKFLKGKWIIKILPQTVHVAYKRPAPISLNDGPMILAKGFQTLYSGGVYTKFGPLSIRFQPECLYAQNKDFAGFPDEHPDRVWEAYYKIHNYIDIPERFGDGPYMLNSLGQSSIRLMFGPISIGVSNENLWWGPGYRNSLLMTNSAPGFPHFTLNTIKPISTPIGAFEGQLIGGRLDSSGFGPATPSRDGIGTRYIIPKNADWVYFNGLTITYMPKWIPNLYVGATRAFQVYSEALQLSYTNYLPVILPFVAVNTDMDLENAGRNQLASVFARWVLPKENAEVYFEYGREDRSADLRDLFLDFSHSRAFQLGFRKIFPFMEKENENIDFLVEITHLENQKTRRSKSYSPYDYSWYLHYQIRQGYTNSGQMLGAGIGPGSNMQTIQINWLKGIKKLGIQLERYVHNNDFRYNAGLDTRRHWVDFIATASGNWDFNHFIISAQIDGIKSHNYQWFYNPWQNLINVITGSGDEYWAHGKDVYTLQALISISYRF